MKQERLRGIFTSGAQTQNYWHPVWTNNFPKNVQILEKRLDSGSARPIEEVPKACRPALITGAGPSLDGVLDFNLPPEGCEIFASISNAPSFYARGQTINYLCVVDANPLIPKDQLPPLISYLKNNPEVQPPALLTNIIIDPDVFSQWPADWPIILYLPVQHGDTFNEKVLPTGLVHRFEVLDLDRSVSLPEHQRLMVNRLKVGIVNSGCVSNSMLSTSAFLGHEPLFSAIDFGYAGLLPRCRRYSYDESSNNWTEEERPTEIVSRDALRRANNGIWTTPEMLTYKLNFYMMQYFAGSTIYNLCPHSILHELPLAPWATDPLSAAPPNWPELLPKLTQEQIEETAVEACRKLGIEVKASGNAVRLQEIGIDPPRTLERAEKELRQAQGQVGLLQGLVQNLQEQIIRLRIEGAKQ